MKHLPILSLLLLPCVSLPTHASTSPAFVAAAEVLSDAEITARVVAAIQSDDILRYYAGNVQVSTNVGLVTLTGSVPRDSIRMRMAQVARAASGSSRVVNLVKVIADS